jgi:CheY-like chemotaxis protein/HAMP domain-containing protein
MSLREDGLGFFRHTRVGTRMAGGFAAVLVLVAVLGLNAIHDARQLSEQTERLYNHPFTVVNTLRDANGHVLAMRAAVTEALLAGTAAEREALERGFDSDLDSALAHLATVRERFLGPPRQVEDVVRQLNELTVFRRETFRLLKAGQRDEAERRIRSDEQRLTAALNERIEAVLDFAENRAKAFYAEARATEAAIGERTAAILAAFLLLGVAAAVAFTRSLVVPLDALGDAMRRLAGGELEIALPLTGQRNELGAMARAVDVYKDWARGMAARNWIKTGVSQVAMRLQAAADTAELASIAITELTPLLGAGHGAYYAADLARERYTLAGGYGCRPLPDGGAVLSDKGGVVFARGEGLVGQCAAQARRIVLADAPPDYLRVRSGLGEAAPTAIILVPVVSHDQVLAVLEFAAFTPFGDSQLALLDELLPLIALTVEVLERSQRTRELLEQACRQAEELRISEEELQAQSQELAMAAEEQAVANEELHVANERLVIQKAAVEAARGEAERKATELALANRYKSEFLANMSHELRTPLNSVLILARSLADNAEGNLAPDQTEAAGIIHESGTQLLYLINDILDFSKIEAGKMTVELEDVDTAGLARRLERQFLPLAQAKSLRLGMTLAEGVPACLRTDRSRVMQILSNLMSNAVKFTAKGGVDVIWRQAGDGGLVVSVTDTGIGIDADKIERVFNAFEQADSGTSRSYGGTGLGLAIARRLARLLGGDIAVSSTAGQGSTFSLTLPACAADGAKGGDAKGGGAEGGDAKGGGAVRGKQDFDVGQGSVLIVEDDSRFSRTLADLTRAKGMKALVAARGAEGLDLAARYRPAGILLDIGLPDMDGWAVLKRLKQDPATAGIPVHIVSANPERSRAVVSGAVSVLTKPVTREEVEEVLRSLGPADGGSSRRLLVVEDNGAARAALKRLLAGPSIEVVEAASAEQALERMADERPVDGIVLDLGLPGLGGREFLERLVRDGRTVPPVVIHTGRDLSDEEVAALRPFTDRIVVKGEQAGERLLNEVTLFLHRLGGTASPPPAPAPAPAPVPAPPLAPAVAPAAIGVVAGPAKPVRTHDDILAGRTALVVDDDMRNAFAVGRVLGTWGVNVQIADNGAKALDMLDRRQDIDVVLMDIMMPGMDGYEVMRAIRAQRRFQTLPILALTAKAMPGDRDLCLQAGASDYLSKPVDIDRLLAMLRVWLARPA